MKSKNLELRKFNQDHCLRVKIKLTKEFKIRLWIAKELIKLAAGILDCDLEFDFENKF